VQDARYHLTKVVVDHVYQSWRSVAIDTSHVSHDPDEKSGLFQDLALAGVFGRLARSAAPAGNGPKAERRRLPSANQEQPALVVEDDSTGTRLPIGLHSDILVSARRTRDGVLIRYEKPTTCAQIGIGVGVTLSRFLWIALLIFLLFFIVTSPQTAAAIANNLWNAILAVFNGLSSFVQSL
jgi:hypothetical protein